MSGQKSCVPTEHSAKRPYAGAQRPCTPSYTDEISCRVRERRLSAAFCGCTPRTAACAAVRPGIAPRLGSPAATFVALSIFRRCGTLLAPVREYSRYIVFCQSYFLCFAHILRRCDIFLKFSQRTAKAPGKWVYPASRRLYVILCSYAAPLFSFPQRRACKHDYRIDLKSAQQHHHRHHKL